MTMSREERLAMMRNRMSKHKSGGGVSYWRPEEGKHKIRILPEVGNMQIFFQEKGTHEVIVGKETKTLVCPAFTTNDELACPLCEFEHQLYDAGEKDEADKWRVRRAYLMNIILRPKEDEEEDVDSDGIPNVYSYTPGIKVFEELNGIVADTEFGDFTDLEEGRDITVERKGKGRNDTSYKVRASPRISLLHKDPEVVEAILKKAKDHSKICENLPTYEELLEASGLADLMDEPQPERPKNRKTSHRPVEDDEDDDL